MEKIKNWIKNNKGFTIIILLAFILIIILGAIFIRLLSGNSTNKYGNRLDGIEEVVITDDTYEEVKKEVMESDLAEDVSIRLQGKIVYTTIVLKEGTDSSKAKELSSNTLDNYSEEELKFYDFSYFLKWQNDDETKVITGNKHHSLDTITWTNN